MGPQYKAKTPKAESDCFRASEEVSSKQEVSERPSSLASSPLVETDDIFLDVASLIEKSKARRLSISQRAPYSKELADWQKDPRGRAEGHPKRKLWP